MLDRVVSNNCKGNGSVRVKVEAFGLDSTSVKVHPDGTGALKKTVRNPSASPRGGWNTKIHMVCRGTLERRSRSRSLPATPTTPPEGRELLNGLETPAGNPAMVMDRAYEDNATRQLVLDLGFVPVVPPKRNREDPWEYDRELYKRRNEVERLFRRLKGFRRIFSRFEKLDVVFLGFIVFVLVIEVTTLVLTRPNMLGWLD